MREIRLTQSYITQVDDSDFEWLSKSSWHAHVSGGYKQCISRKVYARRGTLRKGVNKKYYMHREIMDAPKEMVVDHIDGNSLNNQRANLQIVTQLENIKNSGPLFKKKLDIADDEPIW